VVSPTLGFLGHSKTLLCMLCLSLFALIAWGCSDASVMPQAGPAVGSGGPPPVIVRIVALDWYQAPPLPGGVDACFSVYDGTPIEHVPVVRIWGATPAGQKACVHLHKVTHSRHRECASKGCYLTLTSCTWQMQAFPYFYVPYDDDLPSTPNGGEGFCWYNEIIRFLLPCRQRKGCWFELMVQHTPFALLYCSCFLPAAHGLCH
jgi:hypothetical protein